MSKELLMELILAVETDVSARWLSEFIDREGIPFVYEWYLEEHPQTIAN